jgi:hypothetical protein
MKGRPISRRPDPTQRGWIAGIRCRQLVASQLSGLWVRFDAADWAPGTRTKVLVRFRPLGTTPSGALWATLAICYIGVRQSSSSGLRSRAAMPPDDVMGLTDAFLSREATGQRHRPKSHQRAPYSSIASHVVVMQHGPLLGCCRCFLHAMISMTSGLTVGGVRPHAPGRAAGRVVAALGPWIGPTDVVALPPWPSHRRRRGTAAGRGTAVAQDQARQICSD